MPNDNNNGHNPAANGRGNQAAAIQILHQDLERLNRRMTDTDSQIRRLYRTTKLDEIEAATEKHLSQSELLDTMTGLTESVGLLVGLQREALDPNLAGQRYNAWIKGQEQRQRNKRLARLRYLSTLTQEVTELCPCGKHKGIKFSTKDGRVEEENYCPMWWWVDMSYMAYMRGPDVSAKFREKYHPVEKYLGKYRIKK